MFMRLILIVALVLACGGPAHGQGNSDAGKSNAGGSAGHSNENAGHSPDVENGNGPAGVGNGVSDAPGLSGSGNEADDAPPGPAPNTAAGQTLTSEQAREAVQSHEAKPLADMVDQIGQRHGGEVIDANLLRVGQVLVYAIRVLDRNGQLTVQYYHARSGRYIGSK